MAFTSAFRFSPAARRYVRSTSAASRRDAERARFKVQGPNLASKAFLSLKSLALKAYLKAYFEILAKFAFPPSYNPSPQGRADPQTGSKMMTTTSIHVLVYPSTSCIWNSPPTIDGHAKPQMSQNIRKNTARVMRHHLTYHNARRAAPLQM